jgi:hypothetical protein
MRKFKLLSLLFALVCATSMWAATEVTITQNDFPSSGESFTKDGVTVSADGIDAGMGNLMGPGSFSTTLGNFTQIEVTAEDVSMLSGEGWSGNWQKKTWTGNASSVSFSGEIMGNSQGVTLKFTIEPAAEPEPSDYSIALGDASIADKVILSANESEAGQTVTVAPAEGYEITSLTVSYLTNNYSVRVKEEFYGDIEDVDPQVVTLPREFTVYPQTGDDGSYTYNDISGGDDKVEYVSRTDNTITFRVTGAFDGIASIEYEYNTQECYWDDELGEDFCWDQTSIQDIQVACSQIGGNAAVSENAGVYSFTMPAGNVTITAMVEAIAAPAEDVNITPNADPDHAGVYYSTFFDSANKYELPAGVEAYIVTTVSGDAMQLQKVADAGQTIPAGAGVILKATVTPFTLTLSDDEAVSVEGNRLEGSDISIATPANCYVLAGNDGVGFYHYTASMLNPHKAYIIYAPNSGNQAPRRLRFAFETATGVENVQGDNVQSTKVIENGVLYIIKNGVKYNAMGQEVK